MKKILVMGAGGFIGHHLARWLVNLGHEVVGVDLHLPEYCKPNYKFITCDLRVREHMIRLLIGEQYDEIYQLAADMGGAGFVFTKENDAEIMTNSATINLNLMMTLNEEQKLFGKRTKVFFSSSACVYPEHNQMDPNNPECREHTAIPANPDSCYGWEKLFSELMYDSYRRNMGVDVRIARYHNIFGPECSWNDGREKAPAALCRKVAEYNGAEPIEIWGDGKQTRSFLYIDDCIRATLLLMESNHHEPVNIGSEEMVSIEQLAWMICGIAGKDAQFKYVDGPQGVRGRCSNNGVIQSKTGWVPFYSLNEGLAKLYPWIEKQVMEATK